MNAHNMSWSAIVGELLKGEDNYENWRSCIRNYLRKQDLWDVVKETSECFNQHHADDSKAWQKRNVSALHAIQISCAPTMLSYIKDKDTAKDAWDTLAQMCQSLQEKKAVAKVVERNVILEFIKSIKEGDLETTDNLLSRHPHLIHAAIFRNTDCRPLYLVIMLGNLETINILLRHMSEEDLKMQDSYGRTALHHVSLSSGSRMSEIAERLIIRNKALLTIPDNVGFIPFTDACLKGHKDLTHYLYKKTTSPVYDLLSQEEEQTNQAVSAICWCIRNKLFDVAWDLLRRRPKLAVSSHKGTNAVLELSRQPSAFLSSSGLSFWQRGIYSCLKVKRHEALSVDDDARINIHEQQDQEKMKYFIRQVERKLHGLWSYLLEFFGIKQIYDLKQTHYYAHEILLLICKTVADLDVDQIDESLAGEAIINAYKRGMTEFTVEMIRTNPDFLMIYDKDQRSIFQIAVTHRDEKLFSLIYGLEAMMCDFRNFIDKHGNNMLHLAAQVLPESQVKLDRISGAALQMQRELQWFKEVESMVSPAYKDLKNGNGKTPYDAFDESHADLVKQGEKWIKDITQSSTIVGTLIITIMFAALFTVPGGNNQETGIPLLLSHKLFKLFLISDAISLFASSTSVLIFVGILTSRYSKDDFLISLPTKLIIGLSALFISIATMMVAFCCTVIIMVKGQIEIVIPIVLLAAIPVFLFVWLQFPLLVTISISTYGSGIFHRKMKKWL